MQVSSADVLSVYRRTLNLYETCNQCSIVWQIYTDVSENLLPLESE